MLETGTSAESLLVTRGGVFAHSRGEVQRLAAQIADHTGAVALMPLSQAVHAALSPVNPQTHGARTSAKPTTARQGRGLAALASLLCCRVKRAV